MAGRLPMRVHVWLLAALLANLASGVVAIVTDLHGDGGWALPVRGGLLIVSGLCFVAFFWRWWRWRRIERAPSADAGTLLMDLRGSAACGHRRRREVSRLPTTRPGR